MQFDLSKIKDTQQNLQECIILIIRLQFPPTFEVSIITLWIYEKQFHVYSIIRSWHHAELATRRWIAIWAIKENGLKEWLNWYAYE